MLKFSIRTIVAIVLLLLSVYLLMDQPAILITDIIEGFPAGTLISWIGIFCFSIVVNDLTAIEVKRWLPLYYTYRRLLNINIILTLLWGFLGYFLAGNWSLIFFDSPEGSMVFWYYTIVITALPMIVMIIYIIHKFADNISKTK